MTMLACRRNRPRAAALLATVSALAVAAMAGSAMAGTTVDGATDTVPGTFASPLVVDSGLVVGSVGVGELDVAAGAKITTTNCAPAVVGQSVTGNGTIKLNGGLFDDAMCGVIVGDSGTGVIDINGGDLNTTFGGSLGGSVVGNAAGSHGVVTLTGANSIWVFFGLTVGASGTGVVNVGAGTELAQTGCHPTTLGSAATGAGTITVSGAQAQWINGSCDTTIGASGNGTVNISAGGAASQLGAVTLGQALGTSSGTVTVDGANSQFVTNGNLVVGQAGVGKIMITAGGFVADGNATLGQLAGSSGSVTVDGGNSTWGNAGAIIVGQGGAGTFTVSNGGSVIDTTADIYSGGIGVYGAGSSWASSGDVTLGNGGQAELGIYNGGDVSVGGGTGTLTLGGTGATSGQIDIGGNLNPAQAPGTLEAGNILLATATSEIIFHHTATNYVFATPISGIGQVDIEAGVTHLDGCSTYTGATIVNGGSLLVDGSLGDTTVSVATGASLGGGGSILGGVTVNDGGTLLGVTGQALTVGSLTLAGNANLNVNLGAPSTSGVIEVNGALVLDGNLNITNVGGFGPGLYRLIDYTGALTDNGLAIGTVPNGVLKTDLTVQTSVADQVNLIDSAVATRQFWNGSTLAPTNTVVGGAGTWKLGPTNWTDAAGATSGAWTGIFAIFAGTGGVVTIDNSGGAVDATGLQFAADSYDIGGGVLTVTGPNAVIRVGDGTVAGGNDRATIDSVIAGVGFDKTDAGRLILNGANTFVGPVTITAGTLRVGADDNLGAAANSLVFDSGGSPGTLEAIAGFTSGRAIVFTGSGAFDVDAGTLDLTGALTGAGPMIFVGGATGVLQLSGASAYSGALAVDSATLQVDGSIDAATVDVEAPATLTGVGSLTGAITVENGGTLKGASGHTLTMGALSLSNTSNIDVALGAPGVAPLFQVNGALTLDGVLNVADAGGFGAGLYRLIDYTGALTDNGLTIGATPAGVSPGDLTVQTSVADQVNLIYVAGPANPMQFWNGSTVSPTGSVVGGAGIWKLGPTNWTDAGGATSAPWGGADAIFEGKAGAVSIDNSGGPIDANFLQFATDGYSVGGGALTLTGVAPTIRVGDGTAAGAADTATIASVLAGAGGLIKTDLGTLVLTGANTYSGGTTIMGGTLSIGADANLGAASGGLTFNGGGLAVTSSFTSSRAMAFAGAGEITDAAGVVLNLTGPLSGAGAFDKLGAGMLDLSGASSYDGPISVDAGTLQVNGAVGGSVTVHSGARLQGVGTVGATTIASGGTLAPGNSIGTIDVAGDLTFQPGSAYEVQFNAAGQSDQVHATGSAHILGGTVTVLGATGLYSLGTQFAIVSAAGGVAGAFAGLTGSLGQPFLQFGLSYDAGHAYVDVTRSALSFCQAAVTRNECAAANGAESLGAGNAVYDAVANLPDLASAPGAFNALSGEVHASVRGIETEDSRFVRDAALGRLQAPDDGHVAWGQVFTAQGSADADGNAAGLSRTVDGFLMGLDTPAGKAWRLGVLGGYSQTRFDIGARFSSGSSDDYHLGAYGGLRSGPVAAAFGAAYTWRTIATTRGVAFAGFADADKAAEASGLGQVFGEVGLPFMSKRGAIEPFAGLAYVELHGDGFRESGGAAALKGAGGDSQTGFATVGLRGEAWGAVEGATVSLRGSVAWRGAFGAVTPSERLSFASSGSAFTIDGAPVARDALVADVDLGVRVSARTRLSLDYNGMAGAGARDQSLKLNLNFSF